MDVVDVDVDGRWMMDDMRMSRDRDREWRWEMERTLPSSLAFSLHPLMASSDRPGRWMAMTMTMEEKKMTMTKRKKTRRSAWSLLAEETVGRSLPGDATRVVSVGTRGRSIEDSRR